MEINIEKLKYPIGKFDVPTDISEAYFKTALDSILTFPNKLQSAIANISREKFELQYRPNSWNVMQIIHHCADSHMNALQRIKLALTENNPTIKPYLENEFVLLNDYTFESLNDAVQILKGVHNKLFLILNNLEEQDLSKIFFHPEHNKNFSIEETALSYAWHSNHHLAQIKQALKFENNFG